MLFRMLCIGLIVVLSSADIRADQVQQAIREALDGLTVVTSDDPYSKTIQRMYIGWNKNGHAVTGVAYREIESFKPLTGVVIVHKTDNGYILHKAVFPDIGKIKKEKDRRNVLSVLEAFRNIPFDPHAERSAVDVVTGATRYNLKATGYLNYMARRIAIELETLPSWTQPE